MCPMSFVGLFDLAAGWRFDQSCTCVDGYVYVYVFSFFFSFLIGIISSF